jgi:hypothetical protein
MQGLAAIFSENYIVNTGLRNNDFFIICKSSDFYISVAYFAIFPYVR